MLLVNGNKKTTILTIGLAAIVALGVLATIMPSRSAFADTICKGEFACAAIGGPGGDGGEGGRGGDTGDAIAGDIGPDGSCLAISATIGAIVAVARAVVNLVAAAVIIV